MGTRGAYGYAINGKVMMQYKHMDSYPDGLGQELIGQIKEMMAKYTQEEWRSLVENIKQYDEDMKPTKEILDSLRSHISVRDDGRDMYAATRNMQGRLDISTETGVMLDGNKLPSRSLHCEYAYVVDMDNMTFEVYEGFQSNQHNKGRFADIDTILCMKREGADYYPVALVKIYSLSGLPDNLEKDLQEK